MRHLFTLLITLSVASTAAAGPFAYATTNDGDFGVLDLGTGAYVHCGFTGTLLFGMAKIGDGVLYGMDIGYLYRVNVHTGSLTHIAPAANYRVALGSAAHVIYSADSTGNLFTIDPDTGVETAAGRGVPAPSVVIALSVGAPTLFESTSAGFYDYVPLQNIAHQINQSQSIEWLGLAWVDGLLYGIGIPRPDSTQYIYVINTGDGTTAQGATLPTTLLPITAIAPAARRNTGSCRLGASRNLSSDGRD